MKLKPCPFCGSEPQIIDDRDEIIIECANVDCQVLCETQNAETMCDAIRAWNTREEESKAEPSTTAPDSVNHPSHYETNGIECIDAMEAAQGADAVQDFCICNAFKYVWRHKHKNGAEDIKKAVWYLNKWLELEGQDKNDNEEA